MVSRDLCSAAQAPVRLWCSERAIVSVASGLGSELVERDVCREQLVDRVRLTVGLASAAIESHERPPSPTTVTTSTASRSACCWSR